MTFLNKSYLFFIVILIISYAWMILRNNTKFFSWVKDHWFYSRNTKHKISTYFYLLGISLLLLSLLDLRGPEVKISAKTSDQKTIILIDNSSSMLVEDVRPNRFNKALFLAKHYLKRAVGQKVSVIVFSDGQKKIVPFTDDYNLIEARLDTLKDLNLNRGGTGLSLAIQESIQYFKMTSEDVTGNILIFTDAEETDGGLDLEIPDGISVGVVGVGTSKGGPIPVRNSRGVFKKNKTFNGKVVISKLDNEFLKKLGDKISNYSYWVATSYSLPTDEIVGFFSKIHSDKSKKNDFRIRPVWANYLMIPGIVLLCLSFLLSRGKIFVLTSLVFLSFSSFSQVQVPGMPNINPGEAKEPKEPVKTEKTLKLEEAFVQGKLDKDGKRALAYNLLQDGFPKDASSLYEEILDKKITDENLAHKFNQATAQLQDKGQAKAINRYNRILKHIEKSGHNKNDKIADMAKKNILKALQSGGSGSGKKEDEEDSDDQEEGEDNDSKGQSGEQKDSGKKEKNKDGEDSKDKKDQDGKDGKDKENKDQKQKDGKDKKKKKESKPETGNEKKDRKKKLPTLLKQLISDDNKLQKKMIDAKTTERKSRQKKDW
jgi:Ca-activated chloride channel family protein